ncbi:MAG TPA: hypothetical protein DIC60_05765 [Lachnospiraceae bacterium]|nr:hypothetical protein [Lachnospiraceae bacterium]
MIISIFNREERIVIFTFKLKSIAIICFVAIVSLILGFCGIDGKNTAEIQKKMTEYMKSTYGKNFVVEKPKSTGNGGFGYVQHVAKAYPEDDKELKIAITWDKNSGEFTDTYLATKWTKQGTQEMENKLKAVYGDSFKLGTYKVYFSDKNLKDLDYKDIINKYAYRMRINITYYVFLDGNLSKEYEAQRAYRILKENFIDIDPTEELQYIFVVEYIKNGKKLEFDNLYSESTEGDGARSVDNLFKLGMLEDWIRITYTPSLKDKYPEMKNAEDVEKRFRISNNITGY